MLQDTLEIDPPGPLEISNAVFVAGPRANLTRGALIRTYTRVTLRNVTLIGGSVRARNESDEGGSLLVLKNVTITRGSDGVVMAEAGARLEAQGVRIRNVGTGIHLQETSNVTVARMRIEK